jgi:ketosteroid isomerase-like protein
MGDFTVVNRFIAGLESGNISDVLGCYAADARIWHNFDQIEMSPEQNASSIEQLIRLLPERQYTNIKRFVIEGGVVQQHVITGVTDNGRRIEWPGCIVFSIQNDRISRLEEYVDIQSLTKQLS